MFAKKRCSLGTVDPQTGEEVVCVIHAETHGGCIPLDGSEIGVTKPGKFKFKKSREYLHNWCAK